MVRRLHSSSAPSRLQCSEVFNDIFSALQLVVDITTGEAPTPTRQTCLERPSCTPKSAAPTLDRRTEPEHALGGLGCTPQTTKDKTKSHQLAFQNNIFRWESQSNRAPSSIRSAILYWNNLQQTAQERFTVIYKKPGRSAEPATKR